MATRTPSTANWRWASEHHNGSIRRDLFVTAGFIALGGVAVVAIAPSSSNPTVVAAQAGLDDALHKVRPGAASVGGSARSSGTSLGAGLYQTGAGVLADQLPPQAGSAMRRAFSCLSLSRIRASALASVTAGCAAARSMRKLAQPRETPELRLAKELQAARTTQATLWHQVTRRRVELSQRIGQRGAVIGSFTGLDGVARPIQITSTEAARRLYRRLPNDLAGGREYAVEAVRQGCARWDDEAERTGLTQLADRAGAASKKVRELEARAAAQLRPARGTRA